MTASTELTETSPELLEALQDASRNTEWQADVLHTGGGCMVARLYGAGNGAEVWLTREEDWIVGFYNFTLDEEDEGICLNLRGYTNYQTGGNTMDDPAWVAQQILGLLERM